MKNTLLYILAIPLLPILAAFSSVSAASQDPRVLRSDVSGFHFILTVPLSDIPSVVDSSGAAFERMVLVGIPFGADVTLHSVRGEVTATLSGEAGCPGALPLAELSETRTVRGRQFVSVRVNPVRDRQVFGEVEVELTFRGGMTVTGYSVPDPRFEPIFTGLLANWDQARTWPKPARAFARTAAENPFSSQDIWYKIAVNRNGLHRVTGSELRAAGLFSTSVASGDLRLYNGGGRQVPIDNSEPRPELTEVAIRVQDGGDGIFNPEDTLYFYGESLARWIYQPGQDPVYNYHHYAEQNIYWLAVTSSLPGSALRMTSVDASPSGIEDTIVTSYRHRVHLERDSLLFWESDGRVYDYYRWLWTNHAAPSFFVSTPNLINDNLESIFVAGITTEVRPDTLYELAVNDQIAMRESCTDAAGCSFTDCALVDGLNELDVIFYGSGPGQPYVDYIDVEYTALARPVGSVVDMAIKSDQPLTALVEIVDDYLGEPIVLNLDDPLRPVLLSGFVRSAGVISLSMGLTAEGPNRIMAVVPGNSAAPVGIEKVTIENRREIPGQVDIFVVTADQFVAPLESWVAYREADGYSIQIVTVDDLYDNFSWGLQDPGAIRDFLKYAYGNYPAPAPSVALFVGDGNYDFLDNLGFGAINYVPPYTNGADASHSYSDDNYVFFGSYGHLDGDSSYVTVPDRGIDMVVARWPVTSASEISVITDKVRRYESPTGFGLWRANVTLIADDEFTDDRSSEIIHTQQAEMIADRLPRYFTRSKVYSIEHPFVGGNKPSMSDAIVESFNDGSLVISYIGHGNPILWSHEQIFTSASDLPRLNNYDRLPLVFAASCAIGFYDDPQLRAMAEDFLVYPEGGAIAVISATRLVYSTRNHAFHREVFDFLFGDDSLTIAEAMFAAKLKHQYESSSSQVRNDRAFACFADPCLRLGIPALRMETDTAMDSLMALMPVHLEGQVVTADGAPFLSDGTATVSVFDADKERTYVSTEHGGTAVPIDYSVNGATIYRGTVPVSAGSFDLQFVPPMDIGYGGRGAHIEYYFELDSIDGLGVTDSLTVSEQIANSDDSTGPAIDYFFSDREDFTSGDVVAPGEELVLVLSDNSGINLTGWLGHGISLVIDDREDQEVNLTGLFQYDENEYQSGRLGYSPSDLDPGRHEFRVRAWDNANNSSMVEFAAEIVANPDETIRDLLNYPNPMADSTNFAFYSLRPLDNFFLDIFTLSGRKIQSFALYSLGAGYHDDIVWRGTDFSGDRVATGVYVYKATARPEGGQADASLFGKVVVVNQ